MAAVEAGHPQGELKKEGIVEIVQPQSKIEADLMNWRIYADKKDGQKLIAQEWPVCSKEEGTSKGRDGQWYKKRLWVISHLLHIDATKESLDFKSVDGTICHATFDHRYQSNKHRHEMHLSFESVLKLFRAALRHERITSTIPIGKF